MYDFSFGRLLDLKYELARIRNIEDRFRHTYILGSTGTGKTTLMLRMALYDIKQGLACIFIDPKGQHARELYSLVPDKSRVTYFSYENPAFRINPLRKGGYRLEDMTDEFIEILDILIKQTSPTNPPSTEGMKEVLGEAIPVFREEDRDIGSLYNFLRFEQGRKECLARVFGSSSSKWPLYWQEFDAKDNYGRPRNPEPVQTASRVAIRLNKFVKDERFRRIVTGSNELDIASIAKNGQVIIVDTSGMGLEKRVYITALFSFAVKSYCEFQKQDEYHPLMFYLDECWMGINDSFEYVLSFGRSFKAGFTLAHQGVNQFDNPKTVKRITSCCNTKVAFALPGIDEARLMAEIFGLTTRDFHNLQKYEAWVRIFNQNSPVDTYPAPKIDKLEDPPVMPLSDDRLSEEETTPMPEEPILEAPIPEEPPPLVEPSTEPSTEPSVNFLKDCWFSC